MTDADRKDIALAEYKEVVTQFRKLTDIRFKLLTYLPVGTVAAALLKDDLVKQPAIPAFAFVVTLCMATYDKRNDQHYDELVARTAELERKLQIEHGSFSDRPTSWLKYGPFKVEHRWPIGLMYAAAASLWAYLFVNALDKDRFWLDWLEPRLIWLQPWLMYLQHNLIWLKVFAPLVVLACWRGLHCMERAHKRTLRKVVKSLMMQLVGLNVGALQREQSELVNKIAEKQILDVDEHEVQRRVVHHWDRYKQKRDSRAASTLLAKVIDLPARWIEDVWSGRR
jgi:hypothetical protein